MESAPIQLNEELGEILCPECEGHGCIPKEIKKMDEIQMTCQKCQGKGKLDWCEQAVGVAPKPYFQFDSSASMSIESTPTGDNKFYELYMQQMSEDLANEIDAMVLRSFENDLEHNENKQIGDEVYDYGKFLKFLFLPASKSEIKDQKD